jgi:hypothetical protein
MIPEASTPTTTSKLKLVANAEFPPLWRDSWIKYIPLIGKTIVVAMNAMRYQTTLEQSADFIADDLESNESRWVGMRIGTIDASQ